jgi:hypothetical protein
MIMWTTKQKSGHPQSFKSLDPVTHYVLNAERSELKMKPEKARIYLMPIICLWRDRTIKTGGHNRIIAPMIYIAKGRTLTVEGYDNTGTEPLLIATPFDWMFKVYGNVRIQRNAMTPDLIRDLFR